MPGILPRLPTPGTPGMDLRAVRHAFRARLGLPDGKLGAIAAAHTFGKIVKVTDFIAAALHLPPAKGRQTVRYYGIYSNKSRGK